MVRTYTIEQLKQVVSDVALRHGAHRVCLFGSYARGEARPDSDVDLLVDRGEMKGLFALSGFLDDLEDALGCSVDLVTTDARDQSFLKQIQNDEVVLYDAKR